MYRRRSVLGAVLGSLTRKSAFLLPFFIFAGLFKRQPFSLERFYTDLTFWLAVVLLLLALLRNGGSSSLSMYQVLFWVLLPLSVFILITPLISSVNGEWLPLYSWKVRNFIVLIVPSILLSCWHLRKKSDWFYFRKGMLWLAFYTSVYLLIHPVMANWGKVNYLMLGVIPGIGGVSIFYELMMKRDLGYRERLFKFLLLGLFSMGVVYSAARGEQIFYLTTLGVMLFWTVFSDVLRKRISLVRMKTFLLILLSSSIIFPFLYQTLGSLFQRFLYVNEALTIRYLLFKRAVDMFSQHPVFPLGIGGYYLAYGIEVYKYPHNILLELAAEMGVWGVIWYVTLLALAVIGYSHGKKVWLIQMHFWVFLYLLLLSWKEGAVFVSKSFWVWTSIGVGLLGRPKEKGLEK